jgi:antitoxin component YwqK of YwqJK toxin-antitoxin module
MKKFFLKILLICTPFLGISQLDKVVYRTSDDKISQIGYFNNQGKKDSCWVSYHKNGVISGKAFYSNGIKNGEWFVYNENGGLLFELRYSSGVLVQGKRWDEHGNLIDSK